MLFGIDAGKFAKRIRSLIATLAHGTASTPRDV
jgi:hypothetical protein